MQIKGDKQLIDLTSSVEFLTSKFDEIERERKEKDELINTFQIEVSSLKVEVKNLEKKSDDQEQYSRRNCLLIHGWTETKTEDTDEMVLDVVNNKLNIEMSQISIDRSHRLGKQRGPGQKPRATIVKFTHYKYTVDIDILVTSRNADRKIMQFIRITNRSTSRKRKWNQLSQF